MKHLSVLIVDDDRDFAESLGDLIQFYGHTVQHAPDALAALRMVQASTFDLIFLDIRMPGQSGIDLYPILKSRSPASCIVFSTAYFDDTTLSESQPIRHAEVLEKPGGIDRVENVLQRVAGEFEILAVGSDDALGGVLEAIVQRGYHVLRASCLTDAVDLLSGPVGEKVTAVFGSYFLADGGLDSLRIRLQQLDMAIPTISLGDPNGSSAARDSSCTLQRLATDVSTSAILDAVDRGAALFATG